MPLILTSSDSITAILSAAKTTNYLSYVSSYADTNGSVFTEGPQFGADLTNSEKTIISAPSAGYRRIISNISIYNADTVAAEVTVSLKNSSTNYPLCKQYLLPNQSLNYDGSNWGITRDMLSSVPGVVAYVAATSAPAGWLKCNGAAVSRATYVNLYQAIGTTFGTGDGSTTFNLPELRGEFVRCLDDSRGTYDSGRALNSSQADQNLAHTHTCTGQANITAGSGIVVWAYAGGNTNNCVTNSSGSTEARPRNQALLAIIKY